MRRLKNNLRKKFTKAAVIAAAGMGSVMMAATPVFAEEMHECLCGEKHDNPNCKCGCQEAKAKVELTQGEYETSQKNHNDKLEAQKQRQAELDAAKQVYEDEIKALEQSIKENEEKAQAALAQAQALLDSASAANDEAKAAFDEANAEYEAALNALKEAEADLKALEDANPDIEREVAEAVKDLEEAQKELEQAVKDEEQAQAEKEEADRQAEEARQKKEAAREALEKARAAAEEAEKKRGEAETAKASADEAQKEAQGRFDEADEAYQYKKGLADGTIDIKTTTEWEEAQKTQDALDAATAEKEKADEELKQAEEDLAEKQKELDAANADLEEKSKVCEETREKLQKAKEELAAAQQENKEDKEALANAKTEKENADKDVEDKTKELADADKALEDAKQAQEDAQRAFEEAQKEKKEAEEALKKFEDEKNNSVALFKWLSEMNPLDADTRENENTKVYNAIINDKDRSEAIKADALRALDAYNNQPDKIAGSTDITNPEDATSLDNMRLITNFIGECNQLRAREGTDPERNKELNALKVSCYLMMVAQLQLNWSDEAEDHSNAYNVGENLAWGQNDEADLSKDLDVDPNNSQSIAGPFGSWYTKEKYYYENNTGGATGHYKNIVNANYNVTGFAKNNGSKYGREGTAFGQTFSNMSNADLLLSSNEFINIYEIYRQDYIKHRDELQAVYSDAKLKAREAENALDKAKESTSDKENKKKNAETALSESEKIKAEKIQALEDATAKEVSSAKRVADAETALGLRTQENDKAEEDKTQAEEVQAEAQGKADAATEVKNTKQETADQKNETFTEAKKKDDEADQVVQDLLDGKEVPALEEVANAAKKELDDANKNQEEAGNALDEADKDKKAKDEDLSKKTQEDADADKEQSDKEAAAGIKNDALNSANDRKKKAEDNKKSAEAKEADAKKRQADVSAARDAKDSAQKKADEEKSKNDAAKQIADEAAANVGTVTTAYNDAQVALEEAKGLNASTAIAHPDLIEYAPFADDINKVLAAITAEDAAQAGYTEAEAASVAAAEDEETKKKAYEDAVLKNEKAHERCRHNMLWGDPVYTWSDDNSKVTAARSCTSCEEPKTETETALVEMKVTKEATETEEGEMVLSAVFENSAFETQTKTVKIPKKTPEAFAYTCTAGDGNVWTKGAKVTSDFTFERSKADDSSFERFTGISVDGVKVDAKYYTAKAGSVIVKLNPEYLETLAVGDHIIKAEFNDGSASAKFTVKAAAGAIKTPVQQTPQAAAPVAVSTAAPAAAQPAAKAAPATGDSNSSVWIVTAAVTGAAAAALVTGLAVRKKKKGEE